MSTCRAEKSSRPKPWSGRSRKAGWPVRGWMSWIPNLLAAGHPLWSFRNVVLTPHIATTSDAMPERRIELFKDNVRRFVRGLPLRNLVDRRAGY